MKKFNEDLCSQVKKGLLAIENTDTEKLIEVIKHIYPSAIEPEGGMRYYLAFNPDEWHSVQVAEIPSRPVSDFILSNPSTVEAGQEFFLPPDGEND